MNYKGFLDSWKVTMNLRLEHIMCTIVKTENVVQLKNQTTGLNLVISRF